MILFCPLSFFPCSLFSVFLLALSLSYLILAVPMRKCCGQHSCMSSSFSIFILNGTCSFRETNWSWWAGSVAYQKLYMIIIMSCAQRVNIVFSSFFFTSFCLFFIFYLGGTDIISCFVGCCPLLPVHAGEVQCRWLGMAVEVWDDHGPVTDTPGELVCTKPFPSMPTHFLGDDGNHKYRAAYFEQ